MGNSEGILPIRILFPNLPKKRSRAVLNIFCVQVICKKNWKRKNVVVANIHLDLYLGIFWLSFVWMRLLRFLILLATLNSAWGLSVRRWGAVRGQERVWENRSGGERLSHFWFVWLLKLGLLSVCFTARREKVDKGEGKRQAEAEWNVEQTNN